MQSASETKSSEVGVPKMLAAQLTLIAFTSLFIAAVRGSPSQVKVGFESALGSAGLRSRRLRPKAPVPKGFRGSNPLPRTKLKVQYASLLISTRPRIFSHEQPSGL
jgi:hypothetical protein